MKQKINFFLVVKKAKAVSFFLVLLLGVSHCCAWAQASTAAVSNAKAHCPASESGSAQKADQDCLKGNCCDSLKGIETKSLDLSSQFSSSFFAWPQEKTGFQVSFGKPMSQTGPPEFQTGPEFYLSVFPAHAPPL